MLIIDRLEGDWAVIEYANCTFKLPRVLLPPEVREGDVINLHITINRNKTKQLKEKIQRQVEDLFEE